jgi:hypothetical protein
VTSNLVHARLCAKSLRTLCATMPCELCATLFANLVHVDNAEK